MGLIDLGCESPLPPPPPPPPPEGATSFAGEGSLLACPEDGPGELCFGGATGEGAFASSSPRRSSVHRTRAPLPHLKGGLLSSFSEHLGFLKMAPRVACTSAWASSMLGPCFELNFRLLLFHYNIG